MIGWKYTRENGTDYYTGKVNYRKHIGKELKHPHPDTTSGNACSEGFHLGKTLKGAGEYCEPKAIFKCSYSRKDVLGEDEYKVRVSRLRVLSEEPVWKGYGPRGRQYLKFLEELKTIPWFENVGKAYKKPAWAKKMKTVDSRCAAWDTARDAAWDTAWNAAGNAAWDTAWDTAWNAAWNAAGDAAGNATEIIGGIKDGYFSKLMEVYHAGHWPVSFDGKTLVVY